MINLLMFANWIILITKIKIQYKNDKYKIFNYI